MGFIVLFIFDCVLHVVLLIFGCVLLGFIGLLIFGGVLHGCYRSVDIWFCVAWVLSFW